MFKRVLEILLYCICLSVALEWSPLGRDDSDPGQWGPRSGMRVYVDARTGCQYVGAGDGMTPRMREDGTQVCK